MKAYFLILISLFSILFFAGCEKEVNEATESTKPGETPDHGESGVVPEGYFEVTFSPGTNETRAPVSGSDARVQHLRYLVYNATTGAFVKEKVVLTPASGVASWPLQAIKDTLPNGSYTAVFLGNVEKTLFPYNAVGGGTGYSDVLTNYQGLISDARINLPTGQISDNTEYYWAKVPFSTGTTHPTILLQRAISLFNVHRNFVDAQTALNKLVNNIVTQVGYKNYIQTTVTGLLTDSIRKELDRGPIFNLAYNVVGGLDNAVNAFVAPLIVPVTNALYDLLLQNLVNQLGSALGGNADQNGAIEKLGLLLNPWQPATAHTAVVTLRNFPKTVDFDLNVQSYFDGDHNFQYIFPQTSVYDEKDVLIRGFHSLIDVRKIRVTSGTLIGGLLVDNVVDGPLLLNGAFVNITDSVQANIPTNIRLKANYSFLDLGLKSYTQQTDGPHRLTLSVKLGNIANIDGLLTGVPILGPLLATTLSIVLIPLKNITISVPVNLPLLGVENLTLSGSWNPPAGY